MRQSEVKNKQAEVAHEGKKTYRVAVQHYPKQFPGFSALHTVKAHTQADAISKVLRRLKFSVEELDGE